MYRDIAGARRRSHLTDAQRHYRHGVMHGPLPKLRYCLETLHLVVDDILVDIVRKHVLAMEMKHVDGSIKSPASHALPARMLNSSLLVRTHNNHKYA